MWHENKICLGIIVAALLTPLVIATSHTIFPFIFPKAIFFEIITGALLVFSIPAIAAGAWRPLARYGFFWLVLLYICVLFLSAFVAFDVNRALWSNFERMTGVIFIAHALLFGLLVAVYIYRSDEQIIGKIIRILLWISAVASLTGLAQVIDPTFLSAMSTRVAGVFGNPIYLGGYAAECLLFSGYFLFINWKKPVRFEYAAIGLIHLLALYFSGTRSAIIGLAAGIGYVGLLLLPLFWTRGYKKIILRGGVALVLAVLMAVVVARTNIFPYADTFNRLFDLSLQTGTASTRFIAWEIAWKGFKERPVFGWGSENYFYVFNKFFNPQSQLFGSYETWFDHAHNAPLEVLVTQGIVGFVLYIGQFIFLVFMCMRLWRHHVQNFNKQLWFTVLGAYVVAHFVQNIFVFDHPASYMFFYFIAGIIFAEYVRMRGSTSSATTAIVSPTLIRFAQGVVVLSTIFIVVPSVRQNLADLEGQRFVSMGNLGAAQRTFEEALAIQGPHTADVLLDIGRTLTTIPPEELAKQKKYFDFGISALNRLVSEYEPANVLAALLQGQLLTQEVQRGDIAAAAGAEKAFQRAVHYSPDRQQLYYSWARLKFALNETNEGIRLMETAVALQPDVALSHWYFATFLAEVDPKRAAHELARALALRHTLYGAEQVRLAGLIFSRGEKYALAVQQYRWLADNGYILDPTGKLIPEFDEVAAKAHDTATRQWLRAKFPSAPLPPIK